MKLAVEQLKEICRQNGVKLTQQRLEIYREIMKAGDHPSAEDVHTRVRPRLPTVSLDTVYRTLSSFEEWGLVTKIRLPDDRTRFDPRMDRHHHIICKKCHCIIDFYWETFNGLDLPDGIREQIRPETIQVEIRGICHACSDAEND